MYLISFRSDIGGTLTPKKPKSDIAGGCPPRVTGAPTIEQCFYTLWPAIKHYYEEPYNYPYLTFYVYEIHTSNMVRSLDWEELSRDYQVCGASITRQMAYLDPVELIYQSTIQIHKSDLGTVLTTNSDDPDGDPIDVSPSVNRIVTVDGPTMDLESRQKGWHQNFGPSYTPMEMLDLGIFEGIYTHAIKGIPAKYKKHPKVKGSKGPDISVNRFGVKSRQSLTVWRDNGWTTKHSPLGWWEWYVKYYEGRRIPGEDEWQIARWRSFIARHQAQIVHAKVLKDLSKRQKQRQGLLQWGWDSTHEMSSEKVSRNARKLAKMTGSVLIPSIPKHLL